MDYRAQTVSKNLVSDPLSEDRFIINQNLFALADGAGGTGLFCGEWAEYLLSNLPQKPIESFEDFTSWFTSIAEVFIEHHESTIQNDSTKLVRFYNEGSSSTLAAVWISNETIHFMTYGDAHLFVSKEQRFFSCPYQNPIDFENRTYLLNWMYLPTIEGFQCGTITTGFDSIVLATDALAQYILSNATSIEKLWEATETQASFTEALSKMQNIKEDDYTLIFIKNDVS